MAEKNARGKLALLVAVIILWMAAFTAIPALAALPLVGCDCNQSTDLGLWKGKTNYFTTFTWNETGGLDGSGALKFTGTIDNLTMMYAEGITLKKGSTYEISYWIKSDVNVQPYLAIEPGYKNPAHKLKIEGGDKYSPTAGMETTSSNEWKRVTYKVTIADLQETASGNSVDSAPADLYLLFKKGAQEIYIDDFYVIEDGVGAQTRLYQPTVTGYAAQGMKLKANGTAYSLSESVSPTVSYQWQRSVEQNVWEDISSATNPRYTLTAADVGKQIRVAMTPGWSDTPVYAYLEDAVAEELLFAESAPAVIDSDFNQNADGWTHNSKQVSFGQKTSGGVENSGMLEATGVQDGMLFRYAEGFAVQKGERYRITFSAKSSAAATLQLGFETGYSNPAVLMHVDIDERDGLNGVYKAFQSNTAWQEYSTEFTVLDLTNKQTGETVSSSLSSFFVQVKTASDSVCIDNVKVSRLIPLGGSPKVRSVTVTGDAYVGETLTAAADIEYASTMDEPAYQWQSSADKQSWSDITGANKNTYTVADSDLGRYLRAAATAIVDGKPAGQTGYSPATASVSNKTTEPECISLETNADHYSVGDGAFSVDVTKYDQSGTARKVTGASIASSDPSVFAVQGDQLVPKKTGCSVITAEYEGMSASMMMVCTPADMPSQTEASIPAKYKVAAGGLTGRDGGQAYMHSNSVSAAGDWALRTYVGRASKWFENGYRYMSGWFYDDMSATTRAALYTSVTDSATHNQNFADSYSYGTFDWTGKTYYTVSFTAGLVDAGATHYHYKNGSEQVKLAPRSRGWHQLSAMLVQDTTAAWGWSVVYYLDGAEVVRKPVMPDSSETTESCFELRAMHYGLDSYYDDLFMTGKVDSFDLNEQPLPTEKVVYEHQFEGDLGNWGASNKGTGALVATGGVEDSGAFKATNCTSGFQFLYGNKLTVSSGKRYRLSAWVKSSSEVNALMGTEFSDKVTITPSIYTRIGSKNTWQKIVNEFTVLEIEDKEGNPLSQSATGTLFIRFEGDTAEAWLDSVELIEYGYTQPPVAESVAIKGSPMVDSVLTAETVIIDPEEDVLAPTLYQWQSSADGTDWKDIPGAVSETYTVTKNEKDQRLRVQVTPKSTKPPVTGEMVTSPATNPVIDTVDLPAVSGLTISGSAKAGNELTASYTYTPSGSHSPQDASCIVWEISDSETGEYRTVSYNAKTYTPLYPDGGKYLRVTVTPIDAYGVTGQSVTSVPVLVEAVDEFALFVAQNGDDANPGTIGKPFATLERAKQVVRDAKEGITVPITVYLREGTYTLSQSVTFDDRDSGTEQSPITYKAYNGEAVRFIGGKLLSPACVERVTDEAILDRVIDPYAKTKLMKIDLGAQGIENIPEIVDFGFGLSGNYQPVEVYFNGVALSWSCWPNDGFVKTTSGKVDGDDYKTAPFTLGFEDSTGRTQKWSPAALQDLYISGNVGNDFASVTHKVASLDAVNQTVTSAGPSSYAAEGGHKIFFFNLIEEIDQPGESYFDRDERTVYFYPYDNTEDAEIAVSTLSVPMISMNGTSFVSFDGIRFDTSRTRIIDAKDVSHITVNNCEMAHTSYNAINMSGTDCVIENSHIYDLARGGITMSGGDRTTLTPSGNVIRNNRLHRADRIYSAYVPLISAESVAMTIENNEIYDGKHQLVAMSNNDIQFNYNEIYDGVNHASDMAAVYFGRNPSWLGIELKYNYFHHIGNTYGGYGQQSIFWDDGSAGPLVFGNVFYRGTLAADQGGTTKNNSYPLKTYGGQFSQVENNIIVDSPTAFRYTHWSDWFEWTYDLTSNPRRHDIWNKLISVDFDSDVWKDHYKDTQWSFIHKYFNREDKQKLESLSGEEQKAYIASHKPPDATNIFKGNVLAKIEESVQGGPVLESETYRIPARETETSFVEYGKNFKLTDAALTKVRETIPEFENIPTEKIGLKPVELDGNTIYVGGRAPSVSNLGLAYDATAGAAAKATYAYTDPDGDPEGYSTIKWYVSDSRDGQYKQIDDKLGGELYLDDSYVGKYIRYEITPSDYRMLEGETKTSEGFLVGKPQSLEQLISQAEQMNSAVEAGNAFGQVPQSQKDTLSSAITAAKAAEGGDSQTLKQAEDALRTAMGAFKSAIVKQTTLPAGGTARINQWMDNATVEIPDGGFVVIPKGVSLPPILINGVIAIDGEKRDTAFSLPEGTIIAGSGEARLSFFSTSSAPSVTVSNAKNVTAAVLCDENITFSNAATLLVKGINEKRIGTINNGKLVTVGEKTKPVSRTDSGENVTLNATSLQELVFYDRDGNQTPTPTDYPYYPTSQPSQNGTGTGGYVTGPGNPVGVGTVEPSGNSASDFTDIIGHWAQNDIEIMAAKGIVTGVTPTTFEPERAVTRAEFATLVVKTLNVVSDIPPEFSDVGPDDWFYPYVNAAANAGLIVGSDGYFRPDDLITREEMAVIVAKAYMYAGKEAASGGIDKFTDKETIAQWAYSSVDTVTSAGLIAGITPNTFGASASATRAQAVAILHRLLDIIY